mgnify:FL=1
MFWFKNVMAYRLTSTVDFSEIEEALQQYKFTSCEKSDYSHCGWIEPLHNSGLLAHQASGHILLVSCKEEKNLPAYVIKRETEKRIMELEEKEDRKLRKIEKLAIKDGVVSKLLSQAFSKFTHTAIWIDTKKNLIFVDSSSAKRAEDALALLRTSLGSLPVVPLSFNADISAIMTDWLNNEPPEWATLLEDCKLKDFNIDNEITFKRQLLEVEEVLNLIGAGNLVISLALQRENHLNFTLNADGTLSKLKFDDVVLGQNDDISNEEAHQRFDADFLLMTSELSQLFELLEKEFNGIKERL